MAQQARATQAWQPKFKSQAPCKDGRKEQTPHTLSLDLHITTVAHKPPHILHAHKYTYTIIIKKAQIVVMTAFFL